MGRGDYLAKTKGGYSKPSKPSKPSKYAHSASFLLKKKPVDSFLLKCFISLPTCSLPTYVIMVVYVHVPAYCQG